MTQLQKWAAVFGLALCAIIFVFSADAHSGQHTDWLLRQILHVLAIPAPHPPRWTEWSHLFRKTGHVLLYATLTLLAYLFFAGSARFRPRFAWKALLFCLLYSSSDELHQRFVPSRGPSVHDVLLDTAAGAATLALLALVSWFRGPNSRMRQAGDSDHGRNEAADLSAGEPSPGLKRSTSGVQTVLDAKRLDA